MTAIFFPNLRVKVFLFLQTSFFTAQYVGPMVQNVIFRTLIKGVLPHCRDFGEQIEDSWMFDVTGETRDITSVIILKSRLTLQVILPAHASLVTPPLIDNSACP